MSAALGLLLGTGLLLACSPLLWPRRVARQSAATSAMHERLAQAGLGSVPVGAFLAVALLLALAAAAVVFAIVPVLAIAAGAGLVCLLLPFMALGARARSRRRAARVAWPDVVDHLVSAVRSGMSLPDSVTALAHGGPERSREAFAASEREYRVSGNFSESLTALKARLADPVADRIVETLRMSREVGGTELATVLRNLSTYLRQEAAVRSEVEARQSWVVNAARLGVAAPWIVLIMLASRPEAAAAYNTPAGVAVIVAGLGITVIAYRAMVALGRIPEERRWFR